MHVVLYTRRDPVCSFCENAKKLLTEKKISYTEYVIPDDIELEAVKEAYPNAKKVPVVVINGQWIGGYAELQQMLGGG